MRIFGSIPVGGGVRIGAGTTIRGGAAVGRRAFIVLAISIVLVYAAFKADPLGVRRAGAGPDYATWLAAEKSCTADGAHSFISDGNGNWKCVSP
jgi:hypothetical protein